MVWPDGRKASDFCLISTPLEGMPASLGPGLRTVSGASGCSSMVEIGFADRDGLFTSLVAQFSPPSAAHRSGRERQIFRPWHRPHNTATCKGGWRRVPDDPVPVTESVKSVRRKCLTCNILQFGDCRSQRRESGVNSGPFGRSESGIKARRNTAIYCHIFHPDLLVRCRNAFGPGPFWSEVAFVRYMAPSERLSGGLCPLARSSALHGDYEGARLPGDCYRFHRHVVSDTVVIPGANRGEFTDSVRCRFGSMSRPARDLACPRKSYTPRSMRVERV